jgi:soluble lytic murein transglycosylase-like protein
VRVLRSLTPVLCVLALAGAGTAAYSPSSSGSRSYVVARGDNLTVIARRFGTSVDALARANGIDPRRILHEGRRLRIPAKATPAPSRPGRAELVPVFQRWAAANGIPADLLMATTWMESGWQNHVVSSTGAIGIGQLMPSTVTFVREVLVGVPSLDPRVPEHNIRMSARYLDWLLDRTGGDQSRALAAYYQGFRSVEQRGMYTDTVRYVRVVRALQATFRAGRFPASS